MTELFAALLDRLRDAMQAPRSLEAFKRGHRRARLVGGFDRALRVGARSLRDLRDHLAGGRARGLEELPALGFRPPAVDEHLLDRAGDVDGHLPGSSWVAAHVESALIDLAVCSGVDVARVADGLRIGERLVGQHRDLVFSETELLEAWDLYVISELVDVVDRHLGCFPHRTAAGIDSKRDGHPGEPLRLARVVVLHDPA